MDSRLPHHNSRPSFGSSIFESHGEGDDQVSRIHSSTSSGGSRSLSRVPNASEHQQNVFADPPETHLENPNVFATPTNSVPNSRAGSFIGVDVYEPSTTSSVWRHSLASSLGRRSASPLPVADGQRGSYYGGHHSFSSRSVTPSLSTASGFTGPTLNRSNTTGTSNSSTLYSIPSHLSQMSSPPSPLQSIAPTRPRFDYGGHQQTLSIYGSDLDDGDPFQDGFVLPVTDGFAPHTSHGNPPASLSDAGTLPPPYSLYANEALPKLDDDDDDRVVVGMPDGPDLGVRGSVVQGSRNSNATVMQGAVLQLAGGDGAGTHAPAPDEDVSGATKEWKEGKLAGARTWLIIAAALFIGLAIGLGAGLGIGLHRGSSATPIPIPTVNHTAPESESTHDPVFDPTNKYPNIPTGPSLIAPLILQSSKQECVVEAKGRSTPPFFQDGSNSLWSCSLPIHKPLMWDFFPLPTNLSNQQLDMLGSDPTPLVCAEYDDGSWGGYVVSSKEGEEAHRQHIVFVDQAGQQVQYPGRSGWREGMQGPSFWKLPLSFINATSPAPYRLRSRSNKANAAKRSYKFGILYDKQVLLKESTMIDTWNSKANIGKKNGDGSKLREGDVAWMCTWQKTLLEVEILVDHPSIAATAPDPAKQSGASGVYFDFDMDDDNIPTTVTLGGASEPTVSSSLPEPSFPGSPPPPPLEDETIEFEIEDGPQPTATASTAPTLRKRKARLPQYPQRITIRESRPTIQRLKDIQGIDRTEGDNDDRAKAGRIQCMKMVITSGGGMRTDKGADGEGEVWLTEQKLQKRLRGRDGEESDDEDKDFHGAQCYCSWSS